MFNFKLFKENAFFIILLFLLFLIFIFEVIYLLPSPTADGVHFLKLSFNICRTGDFVSPGTPAGDKWLYHGWIPWLVLSKINFNCSLTIAFFFNYIVRIITLYFFFKIFQSYLSKNYLVLTLIFILSIQVSLQFRPEVFALMLCVLIFYFYVKDFFFIIPIFFAFLFCTHLVYFGFMSLFFIVFFANEFIKKKFFFLYIFNFFLTLAVLDFYYPYGILENLKKIISLNSGTWSAGSSFDPSLLFTYYFLGNIPGGSFVFFFGFIFIFLIFINLAINKKFILIIPFIYFFSFRNIPGNYYMIGFLPIFIIIFFLNSKDHIFDLIKKFSKTSKLYFILIFLSFFLNFSYFLSKNFFTTIYFNEDLKVTRNFLIKNFKTIDRFPVFAFFLGQNINYEKYSVKSCASCNLLKSNKKYNLFEQNGRRNPCPNNQIVKKKYHIKFLNFKLFNSNTGYGVYVCAIK